ncbi:hypothetical protein HK098_008139 [Nowakowskiella sp. JEL0407]|nr:hypothetical protein HK098_008139 [Nowakowskiella sp. JEL0407]
MALFFSWLKRDDKQDYEAILSKLDDDIRAEEIALSDVSVTENIVLSYWLYYSIPVYFAFLVWLLFFSDDYFDDGLEVFIGKIAVVVLIPIAIYYGRKLIKAWYQNKRKTAEAQLENLRAKQKLKIEELKKKTAYYVTKGLIERYETPPRQVVSNSQGLRNKPQKVPNSGSSMAQRSHTELRQRKTPNSNPDLYSSTLSLTASSTDLDHQLPPKRQPSKKKSSKSTELPKPLPEITFSEPLQITATDETKSKNQTESEQQNQVMVVSTQNSHQKMEIIERQQQQNQVLMHQLAQLQQLHQQQVYQNQVLRQEIERMRLEKSEQKLMSGTSSSVGNNSSSSSNNNTGNGGDGGDRTWLDKVFEALIGDMTERQQDQQYALICENCFTHNGLVPPTQYYNAVYKCTKCDHLNNKSRRPLIPTPPNIRPEINLYTPSTPQPLLLNNADSTSAGVIESAHEPLIPNLSVPMSTTRVRAHSVEARVSTAGLEFESDGGKRRSSLMGLVSNSNLLEVGSPLSKDVEVFEGFSSDEAAGVEIIDAGDGVKKDGDDIVDGSFLSQTEGGEDEVDEVSIAKLEQREEEGESEMEKSVLIHESEDEGETGADKQENSNILVEKEDVVMDSNDWNQN